jgi:hypothetical protein
MVRWTITDRGQLSTAGLIGCVRLEASRMQSATRLALANHEGKINAVRCRTEEVMRNKINVASLIVSY